MVETTDSDTAGRTENLFLKRHSDRRLLRLNGSKCELMKMPLQTILESVKIILSKNFPNLPSDGPLKLTLLSVQNSKDNPLPQALFQNSVLLLRKSISNVGHPFDSPNSSN